MTVSVVMITYRHEAYIEQALRSILDQEYEELLEVIVADDCSPDNTMDAVEQVIRLHPRGNLIKYTRHSKNIGFQKNFRFALLQAKGEFIALCEGDDFWNGKDKLNIQLDVFKNDPSLQLVAATAYIQREDQTIHEQTDKYTAIPFPYSLTINNFLEPYLLDTNTLVFRNNVSLHRIPSKGFKDIVLIALILAKGNGLLIQETLGTYRLHASGNWTGKSIDEKYIENLISVTLLYKLFNNSHPGLYTFIRNCYKHAYELILQNAHRKNLALVYAPIYFRIVKNDWGFNKIDFFKRLFVKLLK